MPVEVYRDHRDGQRAALIAQAGFDQCADLRVARFSENVDHCIVKPGAAFHSSCLILSGSMIRTDRPKPKIRPGTITVEPTDFGGTFTNDETTDWFSVYVCEKRLAEIAQTLYPDATDIALLRAEGVADPVLADLIRCCGSVVLNKSMVTTLELDGWAQTIGAHLLQSHSTVACRATSDAGDLSQASLKQALEIIEEDVDGDLSLGSLAESLQVSTTRLSAGFRAATGVPVHKYVLNRRVNRARDLLETTDMTLSEISYAVGFSSQSHMTQAFRARLGVTPGLYRKSLK